MKRPYSREFPRQANSKNYPLEGIPAGLLRAARAKARRQHVSLRVVLLRLLDIWTNERDEACPVCGVPRSEAVGVAANIDAEAHDAENTPEGRRKVPGILRRVGEKLIAKAVEREVAEP